MWWLLLELLEAEGIQVVASLGKQALTNRIAGKIIEQTVKNSLGSKLKDHIRQQLWKKSDLLKHIAKDFDNESWKPKHLRKMKIDSIPSFSQESWKQWWRRKKSYYKNQRSPMEKLKWVMKRRTWGDALKQFFSWKDRFWFQQNQSQLFSNTANLANIVNPHNTAQKEESKILHQMARDKRQMIDQAPLSSSWLVSGVWYSPTSGGFAGNLELTTKQEKKTEIVLGKTYTYYNVALMTWCLMKTALGRDGTGAGSVFWRTYLRGFRSGPNIPPFQWSEQGLV